MCPSHLIATAEQPQPGAGSHTVLSLLDHGCNVTIIDNLDNAFEAAYERMKKLAGSKAGNMKFVKAGAQATCGVPARLRLLAESFSHPQADLRNFDEVDKVFATSRCALAGAPG